MISLFAFAENTSAIDLSKLMFFVTACTTVPPLGLNPMPEIRFLHGSTGKYPKANTCSCVLHLPVIHTDYETFKTEMNFGILNSGGFGEA